MLPRHPDDIFFLYEAINQRYLQLPILIYIIYEVPIYIHDVRSIVANRNEDLDQLHAEKCEQT